MSRYITARHARLAPRAVPPLSPRETAARDGRVAPVASFGYTPRAAERTVPPPGGARALGDLPRDHCPCRSRRTPRLSRARVPRLPRLRHLVPPRPVGVRRPRGHARAGRRPRARCAVGVDGRPAPRPPRAFRPPRRSRRASRRPCRTRAPRPLPAAPAARPRASYAARRRPRPMHAPPPVARRHAPADLYPHEFLLPHLEGARPAVSRSAIISTSATRRFRSRRSPTTPRRAPAASRWATSVAPPSHALLIGSPAIDTAACGGLTQDQRKRGRPAGAGSATGRSAPRDRRVLGEHLRRGD